MENRRSLSSVSHDLRESDDYGQVECVTVRHMPLDNSAVTLNRVVNTAAVKFIHVVTSHAIASSNHFAVSHTPLVIIASSTVASSDND